MSGSGFCSSLGLDLDLDIHLGIVLKLHCIHVFGSSFAATRRLAIPKQQSVRSHIQFCLRFVRFVMCITDTLRYLRAVQSSISHRFEYCSRSLIVATIMDSSQSRVESPRKTIYNESSNTPLNSLLHNSIEVRC